MYAHAIILMDEPFGALDVRTRNPMENELLEVWAQAETILLITHDPEEAIVLSDRLVVLTTSPGRIEASHDIPLGPPGR